MIKTKLNFRFLICLYGSLIIFAKVGLTQSIGLVSPLDSMVLSSTQADFSWNATGQGDTYRFQCSDNSSFDDLFCDSTIAQTNITSQIPSNSIKYWRVIRIDDGLELDTSLTRTIFQLDLSSIDNVFFHFNADSGLTINADHVEQWEDNINGLTIGQSDPNKRPLFLANESTLNDHNALNFDGEDDHIFSNSFDLMQPCNYFLIFKEGQLGGNYMDGSNGFVKHLLRYQGNKYGFTTGSGSVKTLSDIDSSLYAIINIEVESSISTIFLNGINENTNATGNRSSEGLTLGAFGTGTGNMKMILPEIIAFDSVISDSLRNIVSNYLFDKYAPPVNLGQNIIKSDFCALTLDPGKRFRSYSWSDGSNADTLLVPESGSYHVTVTDIFGRVSSDTIIVTFPQIAQIPSDTICAGQEIIWDSGLDNANFNFNWSDLSSDSLITIDEENNYWVVISDDLGCTKFSDTIFICVDEFETLASLGPDLDLCAGNTLTLVTGQNEATEYLWMDSFTGSEFEVNISGDYWVEVENELGCVAQDTLSVSIIGEAPNANFSVSNLCFQQIAEFSDLSIPPSGETIENWTWDFGDLESSMIQEPIHEFDTVGTYSVSLLVETAAGCTDTYSIPVTINPNPESDFIVINLCSDQDALFNDNTSIGSGEIINWSWEFGDLGMASGEEVTHEYLEPGGYTVTLTTISDQNCENSISQNITINTSPVSSFTTSSTCLGQATSFIQNVDTIASGPIQNYLWDFGNGFTSNFPITSQSYFIPGEVNVSLTVTNLFGCSDDSIQTISINDFPEAGFENMVACIGEVTSFLDTTLIFLTDSIALWSWNFGNQGVSNEQYPNFIFENTGDINVSLSVTSSAGCSSDAQTNITVFEDPSPDFIFDPIIGLPPLEVTFENLTPDATNYIWTFGDGNSSTDIAPLYTYLDTGIFNIQMTAINENGCSDTLNKSILVIEAIFELFLADLFCETLDGKLNAQAFIFNYGNHDISEMDISLDIGNGARITEHWTGLLRPNESFLYTFVARPEVDPILHHSYFCSTLSNPNGNNRELSEGNNTLCKALDISSIELYPPFPNPNEGVLNFNFILPIDETVSIEIYDSAGRVILKEESEGTQGVNLNTVFIPNLQSGSYTLRIAYSNNERSQNFFVK